VICLNSFFTLVSVYDYFPKSRYKLISRSYVYNYAKDIALVILYDVRKNRIEFELRKRGGVFLALGMTILIIQAPAQQSNTKE